MIKIGLNGKFYDLSVSYKTIYVCVSEDIHNYLVWWMIGCS